MTTTAAVTIRRVDGSLIEDVVSLRDRPDVIEASSDHIENLSKMQYRPIGHCIY